MYTQLFLNKHNIDYTMMIYDSRTLPSIDTRPHIAISKQIDWNKFKLYKDSSGLRDFANDFYPEHFFEKNKSCKMCLFRRQRTKVFNLSHFCADLFSEQSRSQNRRPTPYSRRSTRAHTLSQTLQHTEAQDLSECLTYFNALCQKEHIHV